MITDELRDFAKRWPLTDYRCKDMLAIADRIDAEHERACAEAWDNGYESNYLGIEKWLTENPQVMEQHGLVALPKDADGVPIRVGDKLTDGEYTFTVCELAAFGDGSWSIRNDDGNAWAACDVTHHHVPTVEDVLREMRVELDEVTALYVGEAIDSDERDRDEARIFAEYAAKLRLAEEVGK